MFCAENEGGHKARVLVEACCRLCSRDGMSKEKNHKKRKKRKPRICLILTSPVPSRSCWRKARFNSKTSSSLTFVTWLIHIYYMTHSYMPTYTYSFQLQDLVVADICDMTHSYIWHDSSTYVTWLIYTCVTTHSYMWHDSLIHERGKTLVSIPTPRRRWCLYASFKHCRTNLIFPPKMPTYTYYWNTNTASSLIFVCASQMCRKRVQRIVIAPSSLIHTSSKCPTRVFKRALYILKRAPCILIRDLYRRSSASPSLLSIHTHTHTHTHIYLYTEPAA